MELVTCPPGDRFERSLESHPPWYPPYLHSNNAFIPSHEHVGPTHAPGWIGLMPSMTTKGSCSPSQHEVKVSLGEVEGMWGVRRALSGPCGVPRGVLGIHLQHLGGLSRGRRGVPGVYGEGIGAVSGRSMSQEGYMRAKTCCATPLKSQMWPR